MASGLRAKLNMMRSSAPVAATPRRGGVVGQVSREPLGPAIRELPSTGLRRIGWCGPRFDIRRCLFLDTETTGLSGGAGALSAVFILFSFARSPEAITITHTVL